jgi:hypothetical protein
MRGNEPSSQGETLTSPSLLAVRMGSIEKYKNSFQTEVTFSPWEYLHSDSWVRVTGWRKQQRCDVITVLNVKSVVTPDGLVEIIRKFRRNQLPPSPTLHIAPIRKMEAAGFTETSVNFCHSELLLVLTTLSCTNWSYQIYLLRITRFLRFANRPKFQKKLQNTTFRKISD